MLWTKNQNFGALKKPSVTCYRFSGIRKTVNSSKIVLLVMKKESLSYLLILQIVHRWYRAQRISFFLTLLGQNNLLSQHRSWIRITTITCFSTIHISQITKLSKITKLFNHKNHKPPTTASLGKSISNITVTHLLQSPVWPQSSVFELSPVTLSTSEPPNEVLNKVLNQPHTSNVCRNQMR